MKMYALFVLLLLSGTVEAGGSESIVGRSTTGILMVDEDLLNKMEKEAQKHGGMLNVAPHFFDKKEGAWHRVDYSCYRRMREAMQAMDQALAINRSLADRVSKRTREQWDAVMKDCVQGGIK